MVRFGGAWGSILMTRWDQTGEVSAEQKQLEKQLSDNSAKKKLKTQTQKDTKKTQRKHRNHTRDDSNKTQNKLSLQLRKNSALNSNPPLEFEAELGAEFVLSCCLFVCVRVVSEFVEFC